MNFLAYNQLVDYELTGSNAKRHERIKQAAKGKEKTKGFQQERFTQENQKGRKNEIEEGIFEQIRQRWRFCFGKCTII